MVTSPAVSRPRVLVVDDDVDTVQSTALLFEKQGYDTDTAVNGLEGVDFAILEQLARAVQRTGQLTEEARELAREQLDGFLKFIDLEIEMANIFLDVVATTHNPETKKRCLANAEKAHQCAANWLAKQAFQRPELDAALAAVKSRHGALSRV